MLVRIAIFEFVRRYCELFLHRPPTQIFQFTERVTILSANAGLLLGIELPDGLCLVGPRALTSPKVWQAGKW